MVRKSIKNSYTRNSDKEIDEREERFIHRVEAEKKLKVLHLVKS